jgi:hypothetical protein
MQIVIRKFFQQRVEYASAHFSAMPRTRGTEYISRMNNLLPQIEENFSNRLVF